MFVQFLCLDLRRFYCPNLLYFTFLFNQWHFCLWLYNCGYIVPILGQLILHNCVLTISENSLYTLYSLNVDTMFMPLYSPLNLYLIILWILDFKYILLLLLYMPPSGSVAKGFGGMPHPRKNLKIVQFRAF